MQASTGITLTQMYNVLEALRAGTPLSAKERAIHDAGLVGVLKSLHDEIDREVLAAYGWSDLDGHAAHGGRPRASIDSAGGAECPARRAGSQG